MRVIPPITITDAMLTSSSAAEPGPGETAWTSASHPYSIGDLVYLASTHRRYRARTDHTSSAGNTPANATPTEPSTEWQDIGPTNQWAMFDILRSTGTVMASPGVVEITPGRRMDSVGFAGLVADAVTVEMYRPGPVPVYGPRVIPLATRPVTSWYTHFFSAFTFKHEFALYDLPPFTDATLKLTFTRASGDVTVGDCTIGMQQYLGRAQVSAERDAANFSRIDRAFDGSVTLLQRRSVPKNIVNLVTPAALVDNMLTLQDTLNAVPAIWDGLSDSNNPYHGAFFRKGIYRQWRLVARHRSHALFVLEIEET